MAHDLLTYYSINHAKFQAFSTIYYKQISLYFCNMHIVETDLDNKIHKFT